MSYLGSLRELGKQREWHRYSSVSERQAQHYCVEPQRLCFAAGGQSPEPVEQQHCDALLPVRSDGSANRERRLALVEPGQAQGEPGPALAEAERSTGFR